MSASGNSTLRVVAFAVSLAVGASFLPSIPWVSASPTPTRWVHREGRTVSQGLLSTINTMRSKHGLMPFKSNAKLSGCARAHSVAMANDGADGTMFHDLAGDACVRYQYAGENIGYGSGTPLSAVLAIFHEMMAEGPCPSACKSGSPEWAKHGHYLNLTSKVFTTIGIGVYTKYYSDLQESLTWVTEDFVAQ